MSQPRIPFVEPEDADQDVSGIYSAVESQFGEVINIVKVLGNSPDFLKSVMGLLQTLDGSTLDDKLRELAYIKTAQVNKCEY